MWFFVQECAAELPFLSPVKIIFQKFSFFFTDIVSDLAGRYALCARYTLCAHCISLAQKNKKNFTLSLKGKWCSLFSGHRISFFDAL